MTISKLLVAIATFSIVLAVEAQTDTSTTSSTTPASATSTAAPQGGSMSKSTNQPTTTTTISTSTSTSTSATPDSTLKTDPNCVCNLGESTGFIRSNDPNAPKVPCRCVAAPANPSGNNPSQGN